MSKITGLMLPFLLLSCSKNTDLPRVENITKGSKWNLTIGSAPEDVYTRLQSLGDEKNFSRMALVYRKSYEKPEDVKDIFRYYDALTLQSDAGRIERAVITFAHYKVSAVASGGGLLDEIPEWPENYVENGAIHTGDSTDLVYEKLTDICRHAAFQNYRIILPDKPLDLPYDHDMANYEQWAFDFTENLGSGQYEQYNVNLYFDRHKLVKIRIGYRKGQMVN